MSQIETTEEYAQIQEFGKVLEDFLVPRSKWDRQVPQRLLGEYGNHWTDNVHFGYRTDIGWFVMVDDKAMGVRTIEHLDYPHRVHA